MTMKFIYLVYTIQGIYHFLVIDGIHLRLAYITDIIYHDDIDQLFAEAELSCQITMQIQCIHKMGL